MELTEVEKLILVNQCKILETLCPNEAKRYADQRKAIESGFRVHYGFDNIESDLPKSTSDRVHDVLQMYTELQTAYDRMADKSGIDKADIAFEGFDGNNDRAYGYAKYLIEDLGRWGYLKVSNLNSHGFTESKYGPMVREWKVCRTETSYPGPLTKEQVQRIINSWRSDLPQPPATTGK